jgi:hypothetical protein
MQPKSRGLIHEHLVPRKVIREKLHGLKQPTALDVRRILDRYCIGVVITKDEDKKLDSKGLRSSMPKNWKETDDRWARYTEVGIEIEKNP